MSEFRVFALEILPTNGTMDTLIYTPDTGKSGLLTICRCSVEVTTFRTGTTPRIASIRLATPGAAAPITIRRFAIPPQQFLGAYVDLIDEFAPSQGFGFSPGSALYLTLDGALSAGNRIAVFGVAAEA